MITWSGSMAAAAASRARAARRRSLDSHQSSTVSSVSPVAVTTPPLSSPTPRRCSMTSGTPPAMNTCTVAMPHGPLGSASTRRGVARLIRIQSSTRRRLQSGRGAIAGMCSTRLSSRRRRRGGASHSRSLRRSGSGDRQPERVKPLQRGRGAARQFEPHRFPGRCESAVRQRQAERLRDHLRCRGRAEELAAATG